MLRQDRILPIDPSELDEDGKALLFRYLSAHPQQSFITANKKYQIDGKKFILKKPLVRRNKIVEGLPGSITKYDVLGVILGKGSFGVVANVDDVLTLTKSTLHVKKDGKHVVKVFNNAKGSTSPEAIAQERMYMKKGNRFRPKKIVEIDGGHRFPPTFLTTRRFSGDSLRSILKSNNLSAVQRLQLTIALLRALKEQIHDIGIIHRDIKPDNILVNPETMEVNIIDVGLSTTSENPDYEIVGSPGYIAPEIMLNLNLDSKLKPDYKADIYSMSRVLARLWGDNKTYWELPELELIARNNNHEFDLNNLFQTPTADCFNDIQDEEKQDIIAAIANMDVSDRRNRSEINDSISQFHAIYIKKKYPNLSDDQRLILQAAYDVGRDARKKLVRAKNISSFNKIFEDHLEKLNGPDELAEFVHGIGWSCLSHSADKQQLLKAASSIIKEYNENITKYLNLLKQAEDQLLSYLIMKSSAVNELKGFIIEMDRKLRNIINRPFDLDLLHKANHDIDTKFTHWEEKLTAICNDVEKDKRYIKIQSTVKNLDHKTAAREDAPQQENDAALKLLKELQDAMLKAMRQYVYETMTDKNIDKDKRAASSRRKQDMLDFSDIINRATSETELKLTAHKKMKEMKGGFFGRSLLKKHVKKSIKEHEKSKTAASKKKRK